MRGIALLAVVVVQSFSFANEFDGKSEGLHYEFATSFENRDKG